MIAAAPAPSDPIVVYTGPTRTGAAIALAAEADAARDTPPKGKKRSKIARTKHDDSAAPKTEAKFRKQVRSQCRPQIKASGFGDAQAQSGEASGQQERCWRRRRRSRDAKPELSPAAAAEAKPAASAKGKPKPKNATTGDAKHTGDQTTPRT